MAIYILEEPATFLFSFHIEEFECITEDNEYFHREDGDAGPLEMLAIIYQTTRRHNLQNRYQNYLLHEIIQRLHNKLTSYISLRLLTIHT
jgi:hypothetical protein